MECKLDNLTLSNTLGLVFFAAGSDIYSRDVTITLTLAQVLKTILQVVGQQAVGDFNCT